MVLHVDKDREKIALGLKQKSASPWENVADKYPVGTRVLGEVVNVMSYGAFVKLEEGIEGLVHISEMSWTKRINHPSELVQIGDKIEVVVLNINREKQEISLGMKQTQTNPWDQVAQQVPAGHDDRRHGAQPHQLRRVHRDRGRHRRPPAHLRHELDPQDRPPQRGPRTRARSITCQVLNVDQERKRIALGLKQLQAGPLGDRHPGPLRAPATWWSARSRSSPTSASSSSSSPDWKALAHLRAGRPQGRQPRGSGQRRRRDRGQGSPRRSWRTQDRSVSQEGPVDQA